MLRHTLARSAWRTGRRSANAARAFATTPRHHAEVELTVGKQSSYSPRRRELRDSGHGLTCFQMARRSRLKVRMNGFDVIEDGVFANYVQLALL